LVLTIATTANVGLAGYIVGSLVPEKWKNGKVYGNWCGGDHPNKVDFARYLTYYFGSNSKEKIYGDGKLKPIDLLDEICAKHDLCYYVASLRKFPVYQMDCDLDFYWELRFEAKNLTYDQVLVAAKIQAWVGGAAFDQKTGLNFKPKFVIKKIYRD
jgi:hypothetical protein